MEITDFDCLTFDCYGTLIDWETGIHDALKPWLERAGVRAERDEVLEVFARCESRQQRETPSMLYPGILSHVCNAMAAYWGVTASDSDAEAFGKSVEHWPAFEDSVSALRYLKQHYRLVILSNVDHESFEHSNAKLGVSFDAVYTAQDIGSYKPDLANFQYMLAKLADDGIDKQQILHTAQSLFHDHAPAREVGLATCWIDRRHDRRGSGATAVPAKEVEVDFRFTSLGEMAEHHRALVDS